MKENNVHRPFSVHTNSHILQQRCSLLKMLLLMWEHLYQEHSEVRIDDMFDWTSESGDWELRSRCWLDKDPYRLLCCWHFRQSSVIHLHRWSMPHCLLYAYSRTAFGLMKNTFPLKVRIRKFFDPNLPLPLLFKTDIIRMRPGWKSKISKAS